MKIIIDPRCNIEYSAFYIKGLNDIYGRKNIFFDLKSFEKLKTTFNFNFILIDKSVEKRFSIDYNDDCSIKVDLYKWSSCYAKINYRAQTIELTKFRKITNIPPSFGIRIWSWSDTLYYAVSNLIKTNSEVSSIKKFFSKYYKQSRSVYIEKYVKKLTKDDYIFSVNTLWNSDEWINNDETVNRMRFNFYSAAKSFTQIRSEVGFVYSQNMNTNELFQPYILNKPISKSDYLQKTKDSLVVFNTPAWDQCHGWKLAEYLALGKAIISTPFYNELPVSLEHGKNIHFVSGSIEEMKQAILTIITDGDYRGKLENGARKYYLDYVEPKQVMKYLVESK